MESEFNISTVYVQYGLVHYLVLIALLVWLLFAALFLRSRTRSAAPVAAMLVPFAVSLAGVWDGLSGTVRGMVVSGAGNASASAGFAEALTSLRSSVVVAFVIAAVAAFRRYRPIFDRVTAVLFAVIALGVVAALLFARSIQDPPAIGRAHEVTLVIGKIVSTLVALIAAVWTFLTGRSRITTRPLPRAFTIAALLVITALGVAVHRAVQHYRDVAGSRWR